jgi:hypothetical protein
MAQCLRRTSRFQGRTVLISPSTTQTTRSISYFGPTKPQDINEKNWIQALRGKAFMVALRLYGSETAFFDQTWKPDDLAKVK